jgi:hypothetical protein
MRSPRKEGFSVIQKIVTAVWVKAELRILGGLTIEADQVIHTGREEAGKDPGVEIGTTLRVITRATQGPIATTFVVQADESGDMARMPTEREQRPGNPLDSGRIEKQIGRIFKDLAGARRQGIE